MNRPAAGPPRPQIEAAASRSVPLPPPRSLPAARAADGLVLLSACCFATLPIFAIWGFRAGLGEVQLLAWRFLLAVLLLWAVLAVTGRLVRLPAWRVAGFLGIGVIYVVMSLMYFFALRFTPISTLTLIFYTYPVVVTALSALVLRERPSRIRTVALVLALAGCLIILHPREIGDWRGAGLAFGASIIYSVHLLIAARLTSGVDPFLCTTWIMSSSGLIFIASALGLGAMAPPRSSAAWGAIAGLALVATVLADASLFAGLPATGASRAAILSTVEPLVTLILSAVLLGEKMPPARLLGGALILGSVLLVHRE